MNSNTPVNNTLVGFAIASATLSASFTSLNFNWLKRYFSADLIYAIAFGFMSVGYLILASANMYWQFTTGLFVSGFGTGLVIPNTNLKIKY